MREYEGKSIPKNEKPVTLSNHSDSTVTLQALPPEILLHIFQYTSGLEIYLVSRYFNNLHNDPTTPWYWYNQFTSLSKQYFPELQPKKSLTSNGSIADRSQPSTSTASVAPTTKATDEITYNEASYEKLQRLIKKLYVKNRFTRQEKFKKPRTPLLLSRIRKWELEDVKFILQHYIITPNKMFYIRDSFIHDATALFYFLAYLKITNKSKRDINIGTCIEIIRLLLLNGQNPNLQARKLVNCIDDTESLIDISYLAKPIPKILAIVLLAQAETYLTGNNPQKSNAKYNEVKQIAPKIFGEYVDQLRQTKIGYCGPLNETQITRLRSLSIFQGVTWMKDKEAVTAIMKVEDKPSSSYTL